MTPLTNTSAVAAFIDELRARGLSPATYARELATALNEHESALLVREREVNTIVQNEELREYGRAVALLRRAARAAVMNEREFK